MQLSSADDEMKNAWQNYEQVKILIEFEFDNRSLTTPRFQRENLRKCNEDLTSIGLNYSRDSL